MNWLKGETLVVANSYSLVACRGEGFACEELIVHHVECSFVIVYWMWLGLPLGEAYVWLLFWVFHILLDCLQDQDHKKSSFSKSSSNVWAQKCTFVEVLNNVCDISLFQLSSSCIKFIWSLWKFLKKFILLVWSSAKTICMGIFW